ncbi:MAG: PepSY-associated TM helix domain-containing protein [Bacteroidales bacterium]
MKLNNQQDKKSNPLMIKIRKWSRGIHRDLSFLFSGVILVYALSGICLNHKADFNSDYKITNTDLQLEGVFPQPEKVDKSFVIGLLRQIDQEKNYTKHYYPAPAMMKVFIKGGSSLQVNMQTGTAHFEHLQKRPFLSAMNRLHYNPSRWWTWFSDLFAVSLLIITLTGLIMVKGPKGLWGRGGIEFLAGIAIPLIFLFFILK